MRRRRAGGWLAVSLLVAATAAHAAYDPYQVPKEQLAARVDTIALQPVWLNVEATDPVAVRRAWEEAITRTLENRGYRVLPSSEYERIWRGMSETVGGTFDPLTGETRSDTYAMVRSHVLRTLADEHGVDAVLRISIGTYDIVPYTRTVEWSQVHEAAGEVLTWRGKPLAALPARVVGTWVGVVLSDLADALLYDIRVPLEWTRVYYGRSYEDRPLDERFRHEWRQAEVLSGLFGDLVRPAVATEP